MILIIGAPDEAHAAFIMEKIRSKGGEAVYLDTRRYPGETRISFTPDNPAQGGGIYQEGPNRPKIPFSDFKAVYWRYFMGIGTDNIQDSYQKDMAYREIHSGLGSFFRNLDCLWVNTPQAIEQHRYKTHQLKLLSEAGLRVPHTLVTNDGDALKDFFHQMKGQVIFKPVAGGAHTQQVTEADLEPERLQHLVNAPVQFQEFVPGMDIRVYLVGHELFAAEIQAETLDFRDHPGAPIVPITLPDSVLEDCRTLAKTLGLVFTGIDIRRNILTDGTEEYVFLEGNPSPMFTHFEKISGFPISDHLVEMLMGRLS